jgi:N-acetylglucosamine kinase-like BadF-type ATPase
MYIGVDGGGTRARAVVTDDDGRELARHTGPAGLVDPRDPAAAATVVAGVARAALQQAGAVSAVALCCGLAGAGRRQEQEAVRIALLLQHLADTVLVVGDAQAAMADAFPDGAGVLLVAGTGSIAWARADESAPVRLGGWGQYLGDEGSGYAIGMGALRAVARATDRREHTALTGTVLAHTRCEAPHDLIAWVAAARKAEIAALAPVVVDCARGGDASARDILDRAVQDLTKLAILAVARIGVTAPRIALTGGLIAPGGPLRADLRHAVSAALPAARFLERPVDAAMGAAALARMSAGA